MDGRSLLRPRRGQTQEQAKSLHRMGQVLLEPGENGRNGVVRPLRSVGHLREHAGRGGWAQIDEVFGEDIGTLGLNAVQLARIHAEILDVGRHNDGRMGRNRRRKDVPVLRMIGHDRDERRRWIDERPRVSPVHFMRSILELVAGDAGVLFEEVATDLVKDLRTPLGSVEIVAGQSEEEVGKADGMEDVGVEHRSKGHRARLSVGQPEFLRLSNEVGLSVLASCFSLLTICENVS